MRWETQISALLLLHIKSRPLLVYIYKHLTILEKGAEKLLTQYHVIANANAPKARVVHALNPSLWP